MWLCPAVANPDVQLQVDEDLAVLVGHVAIAAKPPESGYSVPDDAPPIGRHTLVACRRAHTSRSFTPSGCPQGVDVGGAR
jgi:hypothetical protein